MSNPESPDRAAFDKHEADIAQIRQAIAAAATAGDYEQVTKLTGEAQQREAEKGGMLGVAVDEAKEHDDALNAATAAETRAQVEAERARQAQEQAEEASQQAAALLAKLQGAAPGAPAAASQDAGTAGGAENAPDDRLIEERLGPPQTEMFQRYGEAMREAARELVQVKEKAGVVFQELKTVEYNSPEWKRLWNESEELNRKSNGLRDRAMLGTGVLQANGDRDYEDYRKTALSDPETVLSLAAAGALGSGYHEGEGIGQVSGELRNNTEYMARLLGVLDRRGAESFWMHTQGEARQNRDLYLAAVAKNPLNYQFGKKEWKSDPEVQREATASGLDPAYLQR